MARGVVIQAVPKMAVAAICRMTIQEEAIRAVPAADVTRAHPADLTNIQEEVIPIVPAIV